MTYQSLCGPSDVTGLCGPSDVTGASPSNYRPLKLADIMKRLTTSSDNRRGHKVNENAQRAARRHEYKSTNNAVGNAAKVLPNHKKKM